MDRLFPTLKTTSRGVSVQTRLPYLWDSLSLDFIGWFFLSFLLSSLIFTLRQSVDFVYVFADII